MNYKDVITGVSTDMFGLLSDPNQLDRVMPKRDFPSVKAVEVVGVGGAGHIARMVHRFLEAGYNPIHIHSRTGMSDRDTLLNKARTRIFTPFLLGPIDAALLFPKQKVVVHAPQAEKFRERDFQWLHRANFLVENHDEGVEGVDHAVREATRLNRAGAYARVVLDLAHFIGSKNLMDRDAVNKQWNRLVRYVGDSTQGPQAYIHAFHVPEGPYKHDSLPGFVSDEMRKDLIQATGDSVKTMIFENQRGLFGLIGLTYKNEAHIQKHLALIFERWGKAGVFT